MMRRALAVLAPLLLAALPGHALAQPTPRSTGSGFLVGPGLVLTNHHVVAGCTRLEVRNDRKQRATARVVADDPRRDLALLAVPPGAGTPLVFRDGPAVQRGEGVVTYGFPLSGLLSSGPTLTTGDVSALSGIRDNPLHLQISAPVQPGNSGGPLLDRNGHVIGVVVAKLNALRVAQMTGGDVPQNVNFAIKGSEALAFLEAHNARPHLAPSTGPELRPAEIGEIANAGTLFVRCFGGTGGNRDQPPRDRANGGPIGAASGGGPSNGGASGAAGRKPADDPSFRLDNRSEQAIDQVFATPSGMPDWGRNRLDQGALAPGRAHVFRLPRGRCVYDLKVVFADRRARQRRNVNLCLLLDLPVS
ncbi:MAG TPA: trypsin-like peptidase domain-containing protein [Acetobacteraceae bacterium]|jgi:hypothetical protein|nr:trypsin-like peptidase domain-containing protein [Acetobacteraceae bacterium]